MTKENIQNCINKLTQNSTEIHNIGHWLREGNNVKAYVEWEMLKDSWESNIKSLVEELRKEFKVD